MLINKKRHRGKDDIYLTLHNINCIQLYVDIYILVYTYMDWMVGVKDDGKSVLCIL